MYELMAAPPLRSLQGGIPIWADVDESSANLDPKTIEALITSRTKAIMVVHWGGCPADLEEIWAIAKQRVDVRCNRRARG